jgi:phosphatidate cytidylyltransferase
MAAGELARRVAVIVIGVPATFLFIYMGGWTLGILVTLIAALGAAELYALGATRGVAAFRPLGIAASAAFVLISVTRPTLEAASGYFWWTIVGTALVSAVAALRLRGIEREPLGASALTLFGAVFVGGSLSFAVFLRNMDPTPRSWLGAALVSYPLIVTWVGDILAYVLGSLYGRHRLSPVISPKKSVEGAIAGLGGSLISGALFGWLVFDLRIGLVHGALIGAAGALMMAPSAQFGDLAESLWKRSAGVKDSGRLLPGHGGVLDRFDALFLALPVGYAFLNGIVPLFIDVPWR